MQSRYLKMFNEELFMFDAELLMIARERFGRWWWVPGPVLGMLLAIAIGYFG